jgi:hypothetical protein
MSKRKQRQSSPILSSELTQVNASVSTPIDNLGQIIPPQRSLGNRALAQRISATTTRQQRSSIPRSFATHTAPIQRTKGDEDDPHELPDSYKYLSLGQDRLNEHVIAKGVAGCAAVKIFAFQEGGENKVPIASMVLHSEGDLPRTKDRVDEILLELTKIPQLSVEILTLFNHQSIERGAHNAVIKRLVDGLEKAKIPVSENSAAIDSGKTYFDINVTGNKDAILERYRDLFKKPAAPELLKYRATRSKEFSDAATSISSSMSQRQVWMNRWGNTKTIEEADELLKEVVALKKPAPSKPCYLTTACTQHAGLADDCYELTTLRRFRDGYLLGLVGGQQLVENYYTLAPAILQEIENNVGKDALLADIFYTVRACVSYIEEQKMSAALSLYVTMVSTLKQKLLSSPSPQFSR